MMKCCPDGTERRHLVDASILQALGPTGWLVNVSRGSVVDSAALRRSLDEGLIAGAGLDVFEDEPEWARLFAGATRTVLTPHVAGMSPQSPRASVSLGLRNLDLSFGGKRPASGKDNTAEVPLSGTMT
jgi:lactate dehydrogenase-like 2-hydroxyacid dehydrogenase